MNELRKTGTWMQVLEDGFRSWEQPLLTKNTREMWEEPTHQASVRS